MRPRRPSSPTSSRGKRPWRSVSAAAGLSRAAAKARTVSRSWRCVSVSAISTLTSLPSRRPLGAEGLEALDAILGRERHAERLDLVTASRGAVDIGRDRRRPLRLAECYRRLPGQLRRERGRLRAHALRGHDPIDEPDTERLLGGDHPPEVDELAGPGLADAPDQALRAPEARDEPEVDLGLPEARALRGDEQVAGERQLETAPQRDAVEGTDDRDRERLDRRHRLVPETGEGGPLLGCHRAHRRA